MARYFREIRVPHGAIKKLAEQHSCTSKYVSQCLKGLYDTPKADAIRADARKM